MKTDKSGSPENTCPLCASSMLSVDLRSEQFVLLRCSNCDLVFSAQMDSSPDLYERAYQENGEYGYYHVDITRPISVAELPWPMRRFLRSQPANGDLLDVGCSTGKFLSAAQRIGYKVYGVEVAGNAAQIARSITNGIVWQGTIDDIADSYAFDTITAWEVLEHLADPIAFLEQIYTRLKPGGVVGLSVPNWESPWMKQSKAREHWPPFHLTYWNKKSLQRAFDAIGLQDIQIQPKPFAWGEEVGNIKWAYLPVSLVRSVLLGQKGMHLFASARKDV